MRVRNFSSIALTLLCASAWAGTAPSRARTETVVKRPVEMTAEEQAKADAVQVQEPTGAQKMGENVTEQPAQQTTPLKVPPKTSIFKTPASAASAEVTRLIRAGQIDAGRAIAESYKQSDAPAAERADVSLTYGNELLRATRATKGSEWYGEAKLQYRDVIQEGAPEQQLAARNNLAAIDFAEGDSAAALQVLDEGYATAKASAAPPVRSQYFYNYAQALERITGPKSRNPTDLYREAFIADPRRREAADAGLKSALSQGNVGTAADFVDLLVEKGHLELAEKRLREALDDGKVRKNADAYLLVSSLMGLVGAQNLSVPDFQKRWDAYVRGLGDGLDSRANSIRTLLQLGYAAPDRLASLLQGAPPGFGSYHVKDKLGISGMPASQVSRLSTYLWQTGRVRAAGDESGAALSLYSLAWLINPENINAATAKANLLLERRQEIDPDGRQLNRFVEELFAGKGGAYLGNDWRGILRFHTVLGTIYWKQGQWGNSGNPRGAIFQLEHAVSARRRIQGAEGAEPVPGLYAMLADCYVATNRLPQAYDAYQSAAREALAAQNTDLAVDIVNDKLPRIAGYEPTPRQRDIAVILEKDIRAQREGA